MHIKHLIVHNGVGFDSGNKMVQAQCVVLHDMRCLFYYKDSMVSNQMQSDKIHYFELNKQ